MNRALAWRTALRLAGRACWFEGRPRRGLLPVVLTLALAIGFGVTFAVVFDAMVAGGVPEAWSVHVLEWAFTLAFVMLALSDLHVIVESAVAATDLPLLRATPLATHDLLLWKTLVTLPRSLPPVLGVALPAALAFAATHPGTPLAALPLALFTLWAVPLGLGTALALPLLRLAPAARLRESLAVLATVAFVAGWLANAFWMPRLAADAALRGPAHGLPGAPAWSPATWAAHAVAAPDALVAFGCAAAGALGLAAAAFSATRLLSRAQERAAVPAGRRVRARARRAATLLGAFLRRDAALAGRDWPVLLDALASLALWSLLPLAVLPVAPLPRLELARAMLIALATSLGNDLAARALPLERHALAWARLSPVGGARWVRARAAGVALVALTVVCAAVTLVALGLGLRGSELADAFTFALGSAATGCAAGFAIGARLGDPSWTDPRAMLGVGGRSVSAFSMLSLAAAWLALSHGLSPAAPLGGATLALLLAGAAAVSAALLAWTARLVARREFTAH